MIVRKLRLQRGWSQEQLAELSGLSIRTIQRIERGRPAGLESLKALAAVFETDVSTFAPEKPIMTERNTLSTKEKAVMEHVQDIKGFYLHLIQYAVVIPLLFLLNWLSFPHSGSWWAGWAALGWGIGLVAHACSVFEVLDLFGPDWEKRQIEKRLGRKL